jgi:hypothetical protein
MGRFDSESIDHRRIRGTLKLETRCPPRVYRFPRFDRGEGALAPQFDRREKAAPRRRTPKRVSAPQAMECAAWAALLGQKSRDLDRFQD